jgi:hypothetical protein
MDSFKINFESEEHNPPKMGEKKMMMMMNRREAGTAPSPLTDQQTVNPRYNGPGYNGYNLAVCNCEFLEMLWYYEGFVIRKPQWSAFSFSCTCNTYAQMG